MKWFIGDLHFGHEKLLATDKWKQFATIKEHDQFIIDNWNSTVKDEDTVYLMGDVSLGGEIKWEYFQQVKHLKGSKVLILGNHDASYIDDWKMYFKSVHGAYWLNNRNWILTHIPVHTSQLEYRFVANIHGHIHDGFVNDIRYFNTSCEQVNFTPISIDAIDAEFKRREECWTKSKSWILDLCA